DNSAASLLSRHAERRDIREVNRTRWLATAAAALAVMLGGGAALASTASNNPASDLFSDVAKRLGISHEELVDAIKDGGSRASTRRSPPATSRRRKATR